MKPKRKTWISCLMALLPCTIFLMASPAQADSLIGDTVTCAVTGQIPQCSQATSVVGSGMEFTIGNYLPTGTQFYSVDYGTNDVVFTVLPHASGVFFYPTSFSSTDTTHAFTSASVISVSDFFGEFSVSNISLSGGTLMVTLNGFMREDGDSFDIGLSTTPVTTPPEPPVTTTPEPACTALVGVGLMLAIAWSKWKTASRPKNGADAHNCTTWVCPNPVFRSRS
jgi:hypothetical protein